MATLIIYTSRHGTTEKIAALLSQELNDQPADMVDLRKAKLPDLENYDQVILGGSIHIGQIQRKLKHFCKKHEAELLGKKLGLYICYMLEDKASEEFHNAYPEALRNHATALGKFGGEFLFEKMNPLERMVMRNATKATESVYNIHEQAVDDFIRKMNGESGFVDPKA